MFGHAVVVEDEAGVQLFLRSRQLRGGNAIDAHVVELVQHRASTEPSGVPSVAVAEIV